MSNDNETPENKDILKPQLSVIVPVCNEAGNLPILFKELQEVLQALGVDWEVLFVDDGSSDKTWEISVLSKASVCQEILVTSMRLWLGWQTAKAIF
jgi:cellulose synthase/poly-beta-1,6-N-acetylglucosamine synthase-like glycosyltransferase